MAEETAKSAPVINEVATIRTDIEVFPGWDLRLENPDVIIRTESHGKGLKLYDEVDRDAHAGSVLQTRYLAVVGKEWQIIPAASAPKSGRPSSTSQEKVVADFVSSALENCNFDQARQEILQGILYGFYPCETMWKPQDGAIVIDKLICKHPRRFIFTPERELRLLTWTSFLTGETLPERKFFVFRYGDSDNPYGKGLGQRLFWPVWFKKNGIKFWMIYLEKFGAPTPVGKYPNGTGPEDKDTLLRALAAVQTETGIAIPEGMAIEFLEAKRSGSVDYKDFEAYMDGQISKAVLGQTASTEGTPGKLGNENNQAEVRQDILEADADLLDACLNETLIRWLVDYNFTVTQYPKIKTLAAQKPDLDKQSQIDERNVKSGVKIPSKHFYDTYGYPQPAEGEEVVTPASPGAPPATAEKAQFAEQETAAAEDSADLIAARLGNEAMRITDKIYMAPLRRLVEKAKSLDELRNKVIDLYKEMDPADLGIMIAQAMAIAEATGRYEVAEETGTLDGKKKA